MAARLPATGAASLSRAQPVPTLGSDAQEAAQRQAGAERRDAHAGSQQDHISATNVIVRGAEIRVQRSASGSSSAILVTPSTTIAQQRADRARRSSPRSRTASG